jgi:hypothetical protein
LIVLSAPIKFRGPIALHVAGRRLRNAPVVILDHAMGGLHMGR